MSTAGPAAELAIRGPLARSDLPGLYARTCSALAACGAARLICDVSGIESDAVAVEALARLALGARRHHCSVEVRGAAVELRMLIELMGLSGVLQLGLELQGQSEQREQRLRVEKEGEFPDATGVDLQHL